MSDAVLTSAQVHAINRDPVTDPHVILVEFEERGAGAVHRYCSDNQDIISNGETFEAATIGFSRIGYGEEVRGVALTVSNINRAPGRAVLNSREVIMSRIMTIDTADPDTYLEDSLDLLELGSASINSVVVEGQLASVIDWNLPVPFYRTTKGDFPGLW